MAEKSVMASASVLDNVYIPPPPKKLTFDDKAELAIKYLKELTQEKYRFTNEQLDIAVRLPINLLPPNDRETLDDVARHNGVPYWQAVYAQFRRSNENGFAYALLLDLGWVQHEATRLEERECKACGKMFTPINHGNIYCSNLCGAHSDRAAYEKNAALQESLPGKAVITETERGFVPVGAEEIASRLRDHA